MPHILKPNYMLYCLVYAIVKVAPHDMAAF